MRALLTHLGEIGPDEPTLVIAPGSGSVELLVMVGQDAVFSRSIFVSPDPVDAEPPRRESAAVESAGEDVEGAGDGRGDARDGGDEGAEIAAEPAEEDRRDLLEAEDNGEVEGQGKREVASGGVAYSEGAVKRIAVEAARTLVSFRVSPSGCDVDRVVVLASGGVARALARAVSDRLEIEARAVDPTAAIELPEGMDASVASVIAPLAGLLLCGKGRVPVLDFAAPTAPPDTTAGLRQGVMAALFAVIVLGGAGFVFAQKSLGTLRDRVAVLEAEHDDARDEYVESQMTGARAGHLAAWSAEPIDWLAHLDSVVERMPGPEEGLLGSLSAQVVSEPRFTPGEQLNDAEAWRAEAALIVRLQGAVRDRGLAQAFRQRLIDTGVYRVMSQGPEVENRFSLELTTATPAPAATGPGAGAAAEADDNAPSGEGGTP